MTYARTKATLASLYMLGAPAVNSAANIESVFDRGAKCDGDGAHAEADTSALESIAKSGKDIYLPRNNYCIITRPIILSRSGQRVLGEGAAASKILVYTIFGSDGKGGFDKGVLNLEASAQEIRGIGMSFQQPKAPRRRTDLTTYQPAIRARQPATRLSDLLIAGATTCIDMGGGANAGNSSLVDLGTGCFDYGIRLDGALDTVHIRAHHSFPFEMNAAQSAIFRRAENIALDMGRVDDYAISDSLCLGETCLNLYQGPQGGAFGTVSGYDFDGAAIGIHMTSANASLMGSALTFSSGSADQHAVIQTAGKLMISSSSFFAAMPSVLDAFSGGVQTISSSEWNLGKNDATTIVANCPKDANDPTVNADTAAACRMTLMGNSVERDSAATFKNPWLLSRANEIIVATGNSVTQTKHGGSFICLAQDHLGNRVFGNSSPGWSNYVAGAAMPDSPFTGHWMGRYFWN